MCYAHSVENYTQSFYWEHYYFQVIKLINYHCYGHLALSIGVDQEFANPYPNAALHVLLTHVSYFIQSYRVVCPADNSLIGEWLARRKV